MRIREIIFEDPSAVAANYFAQNAATGNTLAAASRASNYYQTGSTASGKAATDVGTELAKRQATDAAKKAGARVAPQVAKKALDVIAQAKSLPAARGVAAGALQSVAKGKLVAMAEAQLVKVIEQRVPQMAQQGLLKSIPIVGTAMALWSAGKSALSGQYGDAALNVIGAGASVVGGGLAVELPLMVTQVANTLYSEVFRDPTTKRASDLATDMAQDAAAARARVGILYSMVYEEVTQWIKQGASNLNSYIAKAAADSANMQQSISQTFGYGESIEELKQLSGLTTNQ